MSKVIFTYEMSFNSKGDLYKTDNREEQLMFLISELSTLLDQHNYDDKDCRDLEVKHFVEFFDELRLKQMRYDKLDKIARDDYLENFDYRHVIECLNSDDFEELCQLHEELNGDLPNVYKEVLETRAMLKEEEDHEN